MRKPSDATPPVVHSWPLLLAVSWPDGTPQQSGPRLRGRSGGSAGRAPSMLPIWYVTIATPVGEAAAARHIGLDQVVPRRRRGGVARGKDLALRPRQLRP